MISFNLWLIRRSDAGDFSLRLVYTISRKQY